MTIYFTAQNEVLQGLNGKWTCDIGTYAAGQKSLFTWVVQLMDQQLLNVSSVLEGGAFQVLTQQPTNQKRRFKVVPV